MTSVARVAICQNYNQVKTLSEVQDFMATLGVIRSGVSNDLMNLTTVVFSK